jgi:fibro-slime domain-containing protein
MNCVFFSIRGAAIPALLLLGACGAPEPETAAPGQIDVTSTGEPTTSSGTSDIEIPSTSSTTEDTLLGTGGTPPVQTDCDSTLELIVRDFNSDHADMEKNGGGWADIGCGMVMPELFIGADGVRTPVFQAGNGTGKRSIESGAVICKLWDPSTNPEPNFQEISGEASFNQWYSNVEGVNMTFTHSLSLEPLAGSDSIYYFDSKELEGNRFFPADGLGFNEMTQGHNYHFTTEAHLLFTYQAGDEFSFSGDDDMWIFVNGKLALDLGGMHGPLSATIDFDAQAAALGISPGKSYNIDIFHAERHTSDSNYRIETSIGCFEIVEVPEVILR